MKTAIGTEPPWGTMVIASTRHDSHRRTFVRYGEQDGAYTWHDNSSAPSVRWEDLRMPGRRTWGADR